MLRAACRQLAAWQRGGHTDLHLTVNVSIRQFLLAEFADHVRLEVAASGADPTRLRLELTESLVFENFESVVSRMHALREMGIGLGLDDFGTGHFSLSCLQRLPLAQLKIDCSLIRDLASDPRHAEVVHAILAISRTLGLAVVAEGVEEPGQQALLEADGCESFQGHLYSRALPADELEVLLANGCRLHQEPVG